MNKTDIPQGTAISVEEEEFYYVKNPLHLDLTNSHCKQTIKEVNTNLIFGDTTTASTEEYKKGLNKALCLNKAAASELQNFQKHLHGADQGLDDTLEFYNNIFLQTINLSLGIVCLIGGSALYAKQLIPE